MTSSALSISTSVSLIRRVQAFEPGAWDVRLRLYVPLVYCFALRGGLQRQDAADLVQTVFLSVWRDISKVTLDRPDASFCNWLRTITRGALIERRRRSSFQRMVRGHHRKGPRRGGPGVERNVP